MKKNRNTKYTWISIAFLSLSFITVKLLNLGPFQFNITRHNNNSGVTAPSVAGNNNTINNYQVANVQPSFTRVLRNDISKGHALYDVLKNPDDPPFESLSASEKVLFMDKAAIYDNSQFNNVNRAVNRSMEYTAREGVQWNIY